jgi:predicted Zn-dependent protease
MICSPHFTNHNPEQSLNMSWSQHKSKRWYHHWLPWTLLILTLIAFSGWSRAKARYLRWNAARQVRRASDFLAQGDIRHAMLDAKSALDANPVNAEATRIMASALEKAGSAQAAAAWRSRLDSLSPENMENILAWASDSLKAGDVTGAERILGMVKPESQNNALYHATAAAAAMAKRDTASAEQHWAEASRLEPQEDRYRLPLAIIRLGSKNPRLRDSAVDILKEISGKPPKSIEALRALLADATKERDWVRAEDIANALVADPGATFEDKITRLATLRAMNSLESVGYLSDLRNEAIVNPAQFYTLLMWMNQNNLALMVSEWTRTLPPDVMGHQPTCVAIADAYARSLEWERLKAYAEERTWSDLDYMRRAFMARALEHLDDADGAAQEWKDGISAASGRADARQCLERMARAAINWGWNQRAEEVMWTLTTHHDCPRWVLEGLWSLCLERADTGILQKLAGIRVQADPKSVALRNTYAFFSLLIRSEDGNPHREAEKLFNENPGNATIAVTRGLSLFQKGNFAEAVKLTGGLSLEELQKPQIALYHAIFLTAVGETAKAAESLSVAQGWKMFAEEKTLLENAKRAATKAAEERDIAEAAKIARSQRAERELENEKAVEAARAARAAQAVQDGTQPFGTAK